VKGIQGIPHVKGLSLIPVVLAVAGLHAALDEDTGVRRWLYLRSELSEAGVRIDALRAEVAELREGISRLESDPFALERAIREELGLVRPGQRVVRLRSGEILSPRFP
jgi:cell division protein FtsB